MKRGGGLKSVKGIGNGFLFGTDAVNCGPLIQRETSRNNLFVEWEDDSLIVTNVAGGKTLLENYQASADSQILLRIENEDQIDGFYDPVLLATVKHHKSSYNAVCNVHGYNRRESDVYSFFRPSR